MSGSNSLCDEKKLERIPVVNPRNLFPVPAKVELRLYKIDCASASACGCQLLAMCSRVDIKHSTIVVYGCEYEFSQEGVEVKIDGDEERKPVTVISHGFTKKSVEELNDWVEYLRITKYIRSAYSARNNNCHTFANDLSLFLLGKEIPESLLRMAEEVTNGAITTAAVSAGVLATGAGLAYALSGPSKKESQRQEESRKKGSLFGLLALGAAGLAGAYLESSSEQSLRQVTRSPRSTHTDSDSDEDRPSDWIQRMLNLGNK